MIRFSIKTMKNFNSLIQIEKVLNKLVIFVPVSIILVNSIV